MRKDSNNDNNVGSGGWVRVERGDNGRTSNSSNRSMTQGLRDGHTIGGVVAINSGKPLKDGAVPSNGENFGGNNEMSEDSNNLD